MGWFDESDDDEEVKKPYLVFQPHHSPNFGGDGGGDDDGGQGDDDDPLDAFMKNLKESKPETTKKQSRLDVENEEEATSHWKEPDKEPTAPKETPKTDTQVEFDAMFRKAGAANTNVNIELKAVDHAQTQYKQVERSLWKVTDTKAGHNWRKENSVTCHPPFDPIFSLHELRDVFTAPLMEWCHSNNYTQPTAVQAQTLGIALSGKDGLITASTGSGKTLGYLWPMVAHLHQNASIKARGVVLVPTRELALQVASVAKTLGRVFQLNSMAITGGNMGRYQLSQELARLKPTIISATPGRLLDVLSVNKNKEALSLHEVTFVVLDEADKMLQMGFSNQVTELLKNIRPDRQSLMLSATMGNKIESVANQWLTNPVRISVGRTGEASESVEQHVMVLPNFEAKVQFLVESLPSFVTVGRTIVFCASRDGCENIASRIRENTNLTLETLHGDRHASDRNSALKSFAKGGINLLVATDVAGRGLDIPQIATIINFDPAKNLDTHVHRVGRAGRLSNKVGTVEKGTAYTLLTSRDKDFASILQSAFERESRAVSKELSDLARTSSRRGQPVNTSGKSRPRWNQAGLGYDGETAGQAGPTFAKKGRWGS